MSKFSLSEFQADGPRSSVDLAWMAVALGQAKEAAKSGEVPIGAVLVQGADRVLAHGKNTTVGSNNPCGHAEINAIVAACAKVGNSRLGADVTLYVTLQPCLMCLGAILHARIGRVVIGAEQSRFNTNLQDALNLLEQSEAWHPCTFECGCMTDQSQQLLQAFFKARRSDREQAVSDMARLADLPNVNKGTLALLEGLGFHTPADLLELGLEQAAQRIEALLESGAVNTWEDSTRQVAVLTSVVDYCRGQAVRPWKDYL